MVNINRDDAAKIWEAIRVLQADIQLIHDSTKAALRTLASECARLNDHIVELENQPTNHRKG